MPSPVDVRQYHGCSKPSTTFFFGIAETNGVKSIMFVGPNNPIGPAKLAPGNSGLNDWSVGSDGERSPDAPLARTPSRGRHATFARRNPVSLERPHAVARCPLNDPT